MQCNVTSRYSAVMFMQASDCNTISEQADVDIDTPHTHTPFNTVDMDIDPPPLYNSHQPLHDPTMSLPSLPCQYSLPPCVCFPAKRFLTVWITLFYL